MAYKKGHFHVVEMMANNQFNSSINLNARHVNGMTHKYIPIAGSYRLGPVYRSKQILRGYFSSFSLEENRSSCVNNHANEQCIYLLEYISLV